MLGREREAWLDDFLSDRPVTVAELAMRWRWSTRDVIEAIASGELLAFGSGSLTRIPSFAWQRFERTPSPKQEAPVSRALPAVFPNSQRISATTTSPKKATPLSDDERSA